MVSGHNAATPCASRATRSRALASNSDPYGFAFDPSEPFGLSLSKPRAAFRQACLEPAEGLSVNGFVFLNANRYDTYRYRTASSSFKPFRLLALMHQALAAIKSIVGALALCSAACHTPRLAATAKPTQHAGFLPALRRCCWLPPAPGWRPRWPSDGRAQCRNPWPARPPRRRHGGG